MLIRFLNYQIRTQNTPDIIDYLIIGLENALKNGYQLQPTPSPVSVQGENFDILEASRVRYPIDETHTEVGKEKQYMKRAAFFQGAIAMRQSQNNTENEAVEFEFAQWASSSDWTYLPSKKLWYNEEDEENITPKTTPQLYEIFKKIKNSSYGS